MNRSVLGQPTKLTHEERLARSGNLNPRPKQAPVQKQTSDAPEPQNRQSEYENTVRDVISNISKFVQTIRPGKALDANDAERIIADYLKQRPTPDSPPVKMSWKGKNWGVKVGKDFLP